MFREVCAWCGKVIADPGDSRDTLPITHGICGPCTERYFPEEVFQDDDGQRIAGPETKKEPSTEPVDGLDSRD